MLSLFAAILQRKGQAIQPGGPALLGGRLVFFVL
jgi:hypothetical protein